MWTCLGLEIVGRMLPVRDALQKQYDYPDRITCALDQILSRRGYSLSPDTTTNHAAL